MIEKIASYHKSLTNASAMDVLIFFLKEFNDRIAFATSLGVEDQVLTHMIAEAGLPVNIFTLDTGRMFQETYDLLELTQQKYKIKINTYHPDAAEVERMVNEKGINLFYESIENRKLCCHVRKILPLQRALKGMKAWITGLRRDQALSRLNTGLVEWDDANQMIKINPLIEWSVEEVRNFIKEYNIPYNPLHDKSYPSIGCFPCTRAVEPGGDIRSGRWWWEIPEHKECGLHRKEDH